MQLFEKTWNHTVNQKKGHISLGDQQAYYLHVFQILFPPQKEDKQGSIFFDTRFPNILKYKDHWWDLPEIWKTRFLQAYIEESR